MREIQPTSIVDTTLDDGWSASNLMDGNTVTVGQVLGQRAQYDHADTTLDRAEDIASIELKAADAYLSFSQGTPDLHRR